MRPGAALLLVRLFQAPFPQVVRLLLPLLQRAHSPPITNGNHCRTLQDASQLLSRLPAAAAAAATVASSNAHPVRAQRQEQLPVCLLAVASCSW